MPTQVSENNQVSAGLIFDYTGEKDYFTLDLFSDGDVILSRTSQGKETQIFTQDTPKPTPAPGAPTVLRATVKDGLIVVSLNGVELKRVRAKMSGTSARFGVTAERDEGVKTDTPVHFDHLRVTEIP